MESENKMIRDEGFRALMFICFNTTCDNEVETRERPQFA